MKIKVALVSDWYYPKVGGVASHMHDLAIKLKEMGHEVTIVTNNRVTGKEEELEERGIGLLKIPGVVSPLLEINLTYGIKSTKELTPFLEDFDVVHSHHAFTPLSLKAVKAARTLDKATFMTTHSISFSHESRLWSALGLTIPLFSHYLSYPHKILAVSRASEAFVSHFTNTPVDIVPNGVDDRRFRPGQGGEELKEELGIEGNVVLYVSRMSYRKGPHVLLNAFAGIEDATLVMAGSGEMLPFLKAQARFLGVEDRVHFLGYVPDETLPKLYDMADIFVLPSTTAEAFGIVVLEAMASGVPVIATDVGGIPEIVRSSESGLLVPPGNEFELREAIERLLQNEELREFYGKNGRRAVEEHYSWDVVGRQVVEKYLEVLGR